jgi:hypothetical protein
MGRADFVRLTGAGFQRGFQNLPRRFWIWSRIWFATDTGVFISITQGIIGAFFGGLNRQSERFKSFVLHPHGCRTMTAEQWLLRRFDLQ